MKYDFDIYIPRENTASLKYDLRKKIFGNENVMPLWVADMDFACPDFITQAIFERAEHPVYGYTYISDEFYSSVEGWMQRRHNWQIEKSWILFTPGIVPALNIAVNAFTEPGEKIIVQPPVYFPFFTSVKLNNRQLVYNPLFSEDGRYHMDFIDLEKRIDKKTKMMFLCHPHNPAGREWDKETMEKLVDICSKNKIIIISDEIHSDLMLNRRKHVPLSSISEEAAKITVTCIAPSKTFNLAGLASSAVIIPNPELKESFDKIISRFHIGTGNIFGLIAMQTAYQKGDDWLDQLLRYLEKNLEIMIDFFHSRIKNVKLYEPEATYMAWLDFRETGLSDKQLRDFIINKAGLGLNDGPVFGPGGSGFQRLNFALPEKRLLIALEQLDKAFKLK